MVVAAAFGLVAGYALGLREIWLQEYAAQGWWSPAFALLARFVWRGAYLATGAGLLAGAVWLIFSRLSGDRRRSTVGLVLFGVIFLGLPLFLYYQLPAHLGGGGPLPFFCDDIASFAVFLRRSVWMLMTTAWPANVKLWGALFIWLIVSGVLSFLLSLPVPKGKRPEKKIGINIRPAVCLTVAIVVLLLAPSVASAWKAKSGMSLPNVLLISVDTMRADRLGCYGGPAKTPNIDWLAARGLRLEQALSPSPWTLPAHAAMFAGRHPSLLGVSRVMHKLGAAHITLPEVLTANGYRAAGFVSHLFVSRVYGFDQGFSEFTYVLSEKADDVVSRAVSWLEGKRQPWFLFCHFFDPHWPYTPERETLPPHGDADLLVDLLQTTDYARALRAAQTDPTLARDVWLPRYDAELGEVDIALGRLFDFLANRSILEDTLIVLVSDHGEAFGERISENGKDEFVSGKVGYFGHGVTCQPSVIRVPWIIAGPGARTMSPVGQVDLTDLPAIVLRLLDLPTQPDFTQPSTAWDGGNARPLVAETVLGGPPRYGVYAPGARLFTPAEVSYLDLALKLPGLKTVGDEAQNTAAEDALRQYLERLQALSPESENARVHAAELERLRQLGYVEGRQ